MRFSHLAAPLAVTFGLLAGYHFSTGPAVRLGTPDRIATSVYETDAAAQDERLAAVSARWLCGFASHAEWRKALRTYEDQRKHSLAVLQPRELSAVEANSTDRVRSLTLAKLGSETLQPTVQDCDQLWAAENF